MSTLLLVLMVAAAGGNGGGMLVIFYWILLLLIFLGIFAKPDWTWYPKANVVVTFILFVIIGLKLMAVAW